MSVGGQGRNNVSVRWSYSYEVLLAHYGGSRDRTEERKVWGGGWGEVLGSELPCMNEALSILQRGTKELEEEDDVRWRRACRSAGGGCGGRWQSWGGSQGGALSLVEVEEGEDEEGEQFTSNSVVIFAAGAP